MEDRTLTSDAAGPPNLVDSKARFSNRVEHYAKYRPSYPQAVIEFLQQQAGLTPATVIADVGSGTGISAELFLKNGNIVFAVEPNKAMRQAAEQQLGRYPNFRSVEGSAEATTLPGGSVDLALAAQAFHWFTLGATRAEWMRILRPGGFAALIWNMRKIDGDPFSERYESLIHRYSSDYTQIRHKNVTPRTLGEFFGPAGYATGLFHNEHRVDFEGLKGRLLSSSYIPLAGSPMYEFMLTDLRELFDRTNVNGEAAFLYETEVYVGRFS